MPENYQDPIFDSDNETTLSNAIVAENELAANDDPRLDPILPSQMTSAQKLPSPHTLTLTDAMKQYRATQTTIEQRMKGPDSHFWGNAAKGVGDFVKEMGAFPDKFDAAVVRAFNGYLWPDMTEEEAVRLMEASTSLVSHDSQMRSLLASYEGADDSVVRPFFSGAAQVISYGLVGALTGGVGIGIMAGIQEGVDFSQEMAENYMQNNENSLSDYNGSEDTIFAAAHGALSGFIETKLGVERIFTNAIKKTGIRKIGETILRSAAGEGAEEYLQEASRYLFANIAGRNDRTFADFQKDAITNAVYGALLGGAFGGAMYYPNVRRIKKALIAQGYTTEQAEVLAPEMVNGAKQEVLKEVDDRTQIREHYGEQWDALKNKIVSALENAGWKETNPDINLDKYAEDNADNIVRPLFRFSNRYGIDTRDLIQLSDIEVIDNAIYLRPVDLGTPEVIAGKIREKQEEVKRLNMLNRTGAGNPDAKRALNTQIELLQKYYEKQTGDRFSAARRNRAAKAKADAEILATTAPAVSETISNIDISKMTSGEPTVQIRERMDGNPFVYVGDKQLPVEYKVVPMSEVIASHIGQDVNANYTLKELQNRAQRGSRTDVSILQSRAAKIQPENLGVSYNTQNGAPIVNEKGEVIAGNGRYEVLRMTDERGRARYNKYLESLGLDLTGIENPILVRVLRGLTPQEQIAVADASNVSATSAFDNASQAVQDAKLLDGTNGITDFLNKIPIESRQGLFLANDRVNKVALERRYNDALMMWLLNNNTQLYEDLYLMGGITQKIQTALYQSIPGLMSLESQYPAVGIRADLAEALKKLPSVSRTNDFAFTVSQSSIEDGSTNLFNQNALLYTLVFGKNTKTWEGSGPDRLQVGLTLTEFFDTYSREATTNQENLGKTDLFGQPLAEERTSGDILAETLTLAFPREFEDGVARSRDMRAVFLTRAQTQPGPTQLSQIDLRDQVQPTLFPDDTSTASAVKNLPWEKPVDVLQPIFFNRKPDSRDIEIAKSQGYDSFLILDKDDVPTQLVLLDGSVVNLRKGAKIPKGADLYKPSQAANSGINEKIKQFQVLARTNIITDSYHTGIRTVDDIKTFEESVSEFDEFGAYSDYSESDARAALDKGEITVYSSYPIKEGTFVSPSKEMAAMYSSNGRVYSKKIPLSDVAWISAEEGQFTGPVSGSADLRITKTEFDNMVEGAIVYYRDGSDYKQGLVQKGYAGKNYLIEAASRNELRKIEVPTEKYDELYYLPPTQTQGQLYQSDIADENARLDSIYPEYKGETIEVDGMTRTVYNSTGERIAKSAEALRNFYKWFGDSKVVDEQGRPLVVYHATDSDFNIFDENKFGKSHGQAHLGFNFGTTKAFVKQYGKNIMPVYLRANNLLTSETVSTIDIKKFYLEYMSGEERLWNIQEGYLKSKFETLFGALDRIKGSAENTNEAIKILKKLGFDGIRDGGVISVFEPNQIKSVDNRGTFSKNTPNIYNQGKKVNGFYDPELEVIVLGRNSNTGTLPHEMAHYWANTIFNLVKSGKYNNNPDFMAEAMGMFKMLGVGMNQQTLTRDQQEQFASMTEAVIFGMAPIPQGTELPMTAFLNWIPAKYKSILDIGYRNSEGRIINPILDKGAVDWFNAWYGNGALPSIGDSPLDVENTNAQTGDRILPSSVEVMKVRATEIKTEADRLQVARNEQTKEAAAAVPTSEQAAIAAAEVDIESEPGNIERSQPSEPKKRSIVSHLIPGKRTNTRDDMFAAARDYIAKDREHAEEVAFGNPNEVMNDTGVDRGILIRALMEEYSRGDSEYAKLYHNLAETVSLAGKTPGLSNDMNFQYYLEALKRITDGMEGIAAIKYAGTRNLNKARRTFNSDIDAFIQERAQEILKAGPDTEMREMAIKKMFAEAAVKFGGEDGAVQLNQEELRRARGMKSRERAVFTEWANREIRKMLKAAPDTNTINQIMQVSEKAEKARKFLDSDNIAEVQAAGKAIRDWQMFVKEKEVPDTWYSRLIGSWYPKAMLYNINTHLVNLTGNSFNYGIVKTAVAAQYKKGNKVSESVLSAERDRLHRLYDSSLINIAAMANPTSPTLLKGEQYNPREGKSTIGKIADFSMDLLGKEDAIFRIRAYIDALGHIATADAAKTGGDPTALFNEYKKINQPKDSRAYAARQEALHISDLAVFQQTGVLSECLKRVRDNLNFGKSAGLGTLLAPFVKTPANIVEQGARAIAAPITGIYHGIKGDWSLQNTIDSGYFVLACILTMGLMADYEPPYQPPYRYDPNKPYDSVRIRGTDMWIKLDTFAAASVPMRIIASIATGKGLGLAGAANEVPLIGDLAEAYGEAARIERDPYRQGVRFATNWAYNRVNTAVPAIIKYTLAAAHPADLRLDELDIGLPNTGIGRKIERQYGLGGGDTTTNDILRIFFNRLKIYAE